MKTLFAVALIAVLTGCAAGNRPVDHQTLEQIRDQGFEITREAQRNKK